MDVLTDILSSLRLTGGVVIDGEFSGDFCVLAQFTPDHCAPFFPMPETLIIYHYVRSGRMIIEVEGLPPTVLEAGAIAILPRNDPHMLASRTGLPPLLTLDVRGGEAQWLDSSMRFLAEQNPSPEMVARLAELFLAQAIREY